MDGYKTSLRVTVGKPTFQKKIIIVKINKMSVARKQGQATGVKVNQGDLVQLSYTDLKTNHSKLWTAVVTQVTPYCFKLTNRSFFIEHQTAAATQTCQAVKTVVCSVMARERPVFLHALKTSLCPQSLPQRRNAAWHQRPAFHCNPKGKKVNFKKVSCKYLVLQDT